MEEQEEIIRRKKEQLEADSEIAASTARLVVLRTCDSSSVGKSYGMEAYFREEAKNMPTPLTVRGKKDEPQHEQIFPTT